VRLCGGEKHPLYIIPAANIFLWCGRKAENRERRREATDRGRVVGQFLICKSINHYGRQNCIKIAAERDVAAGAAVEQLLLLPLRLSFVQFHCWWIHVFSPAALHISMTRYS
jgi:hypothetical protein